ncbi:hypothetical protein ABPG74_017843 [Tetrahymena malaccensis]
MQSNTKQLQLTLQNISECFTSTGNNPYISKQMHHSKCRDRLLKIMQYSCLWISWYNYRDKSRFSRFFQIYQSIYDARRLIRLLKSIICIPNIQDLFQNLKKTNKFQQSCLITTNIFYLLFYVIDNVAILSKIQFLKLDYRKVKKYGYPMWLIGLLSALIYYIIKLKQSFKKESELKTLMLNNMTPKEFCQAILQITEERKNYSLNIIRIVGDLIVAVQRNNIPEFLLHTRFNRGLVAFGGLSSSLISFYQFYSKNKKLIQQQK